MNPELYEVPGAIAAITVSTRRRTRFFARPVLTEATRQVLFRHAEKHCVPIYAYSFMPDHMHLVIGASESCGILTFVAQFKSLSARASWDYGVDRTLWTGSFWDTFKSEHDNTLRAAVVYTLKNPVVARLTRTWLDYPWLGSSVYSVAELSRERELGSRDSIVDEPWPAACEYVDPTCASARVDDEEAAA